MDINADFIRQRITSLRIQKGTSEYQMSYDLGHSRSYMYNISSGKSLPPLTEFLDICEYLGVTPVQFFDCDIENPKLLNEAIKELQSLSIDDLTFVIDFIKRLKK